MIAPGRGRAGLTLALVSPFEVGPVVLPAIVGLLGSRCWEGFRAAGLHDYKATWAEEAVLIYR